MHNLASGGINEYSFRRRKSVIHRYLREKTCKCRYVFMTRKHVIGHMGTLISWHLNTSLVGKELLGYRNSMVLVIPDLDRLRIKQVKESCDEESVKLHLSNNVL